ncbi:nitrate ABC transporter ATP-binding protein [Variovorax dokdonensis]|uniref:Nitrate ABC transporter ATP-binding protein n=1 Tax=Variovorax dokdonensis TaxID=344883 RepID=A0ABT7NES0_9BURK|nr:nitrate ABC transporter ATP-binding protein [Variovorax dokdonensis]MDM0046443.1 nitrate ABC transporter ATP-binding protein [Variovorax dokdonensis]
MELALRTTSLLEARGDEANHASTLSVVPATAALELRGVHKGFGRGNARTEVLSDLNLRIAPGEFVAIVGFSGSGKTTLVNLLAGLADADRGEVLKRGEQIQGPGPDRGVVFQSYSLMPWLTVRENVALAVDRVASHLAANERAALVQRYVAMVGLSAAIDKKPAQLSGGMRQRVSVARALATDPDVLLMDEPLSALDALTRAQLQDEIVRIWGEDPAQRKTVLLITNDVDEALMMADRVITLTLPTKGGAGATLGRSFDIDLQRPRERSAMNHDRRFQQLRAEITQTLLTLSHERQHQGSGQVIALPTLVPRAVNAPAQRPALPRVLRMRHAALVERIEQQAQQATGPALRPGAPTLEARHGDERFVEFSNVVKTYPTPQGPQTVVDGFDLRMAKGEFVSLIGHSGCGKSTVLSMMAGLTDLSDGVIVLDGREVRDAGPDRGLVFQSPSLVPWLSAFDNVMLGVARVFPHVSDGERRDAVGYYLQRVGLGDAMHKRASELSNGMKQRVGIARAFALQPKLLLLDEPFGMLDALTRWELQEVLMEVWARNRVTAIMVTHDVDEAILLADRVVMMSNGPRARIGNIMDVPLPRPRTREALLAHPRYYELREELIGFLAACGHQH